LKTTNFKRHSFLKEKEIRCIQSLKTFDRQVLIASQNGNEGYKNYLSNGRLKGKTTKAASVQLGTLLLVDD
jgi:hypothetical protein